MQPIRSAPVDVESPPNRSVRRPPVSPRATSLSTALRAIAYLLTFIAGAASMVAWRSSAAPQPAAATHDTPLAAAPQETSAPPAVPTLAPTSTPPQSAEGAEPVEQATFVEPRAEDPPAHDEPATESAHQPSHQPAPASDATPGLLRVAGMTEPAHDRYAALSLATSQSVAMVDVRPGDRVKKGYQVFAHWESPDRLEVVKVDADKAQKQLEIAQARAGAAERLLARLEKASQSVSAQEMDNARTTAKIRREEASSAKLAATQSESQFKATQFEFNQAFVTSPIDGIVTSVDVVPGERRQIGSAFRGVTILDPRVLNCRCHLTHEQVASLPRSADGAWGTATIEAAGHEWSGQICFVSAAVEPATGLVPVLLEVQNPDETLRSGVPVEVRFSAQP